MRKTPSNQTYQAEPWNANTYRTGSTTPPKSRNGIIALLLVLVIVLCGVITVLGITNAHLFRILSIQEDEEDLPVFFSNSRNIATYGADQASMQIGLDGTVLSVPLGIHGEAVPKVHQLYYCLPCGFYVNQIEPDASAAQHGLQIGDIITHVDGFSVASQEDFCQALENYAVGDIVILTVYRNSASFPLSVTVQPTR